jgi:hypothetical protein
MSLRRRVVLLHWKQEELRELKIRIKGFTVDAYAPVSGEGLKGLVEKNPPDALLICLDRLPSNGHAVGYHYRSRKATRGIPIVFVGGLPEKVEKVRVSLPNVYFCAWDKVTETLTTAIANPPIAVPPLKRSYAEHTDRPLHEKLGIREGMRIALLGAPAPLEKLVPKIPFEIDVTDQPERDTDIALWFVRRPDDVEDGLSWITGRMAKPRVWIFYPRRKSAATAGGLTWTSLMETAARYSLAQYKVMRLNDDWSGVVFGKSRG